MMLITEKFPAEVTLFSNVTKYVSVFPDNKNYNLISDINRRTQTEVFENSVENIRTERM
jgi:hypothetical protein